VTYERFDPPHLGEPRGWTNGMLGPAGARVLFVAGQDATALDGTVASEDFVEQFGIALAKAVSVVVAAGGAAADIGRLTVYVTDLDAYRSSLRAVGVAYREHMGRHFPAMSLVEVSRLVAPGAKVEIEATALLGPASGQDDPGPNP